MRWCENNNTDYVFGLPRNSVLLRKAQKIRSKAAVAMVATGETARAYGEFHHMPKSKTWDRPRRVIARAEHKLTRKKQQCRFLVTSITRHPVSAQELYEDTYCPRGDMENRIKLSLPDAYPYKDIFFKAHAALAPT